MKVNPDNVQFENTECYEAALSYCVPLACNELFNELTSDYIACCVY